MYLKSGSPARVPEVLGYNIRGVQPGAAGELRAPGAEVGGLVFPWAQHSPPIPTRRRKGDPKTSVLGKNKKIFFFSVSENGALFIKEVNYVLI